MHHRPTPDIVEILHKNLYRQPRIGKLLKNVERLNPFIAADVLVYHRSVRQTT